MHTCRGCRSALTVSLRGAPVVIACAVSRRGCAVLSVSSSACGAATCAGNADAASQSAIFSLRVATRALRLPWQAAGAAAATAATAQPPTDASVRSSKSVRAASQSKVASAPEAVTADAACRPAGGGGEGVCEGPVGQA